MFEQLAIEQTPVAVQIYTQTYFDTPKTSNPVHDRRANVITATRPRALETAIVGNQLTTTATLADISDRRQSKLPERQAIPVDPSSIIEKTRNDRVTLLARKYAGKIDSEANARLEILTERLNRLAPVVDAATLDKVAEVVAVAQRQSPRLAALKSKYNL